MRHYRIREMEENAIQGERFLRIETLANMDIVKVDSNKKAYVYQGQGGDHFPLPCPTLTYVDTYDGDRSNWKMDTALHRRVILANPFSGNWLMNATPTTAPIKVPTDGASSSHGGPSSSHGMEHIHEDEDDEENLGAFYYNRRTRDMTEREEEGEDTLAARLGRMEAQNEERCGIQTQWHQEDDSWRQSQDMRTELDQWRFQQQDQFQGWEQQNTSNWATQQTWNTQQQQQQWQQHESTYWNSQLDEQRQQTEMIRDMQAQQQQLLDIFKQLRMDFTDFKSQYPPPRPPPKP